MEPAPQTWAPVIGKQRALFAFDSDRVDCGSFGATENTASSNERGTVAIGVDANDTDTTVAGTLGADSTAPPVLGHSTPGL